MNRVFFFWLVLELVLVVFFVFFEGKIFLVFVKNIDVWILIRTY